MAYEFKVQRRVEFSDTDCAGIVHFSVYFRYMEETEHAFLRSLGLSVRHPAESGYIIGFPRLSARCEFSRSVTFEDLVDVHIWISRKRRRTLEYSCVFSHDGEEVARGQVVTVACRIREGESIEATELPPEFDAALEVAPYPPLEFHPERGGGAS